MDEYRAPHILETNYFQYDEEGGEDKVMNI